jgi:L-ribulose-5-phosphate 3-epimerase UlaE
MKTKQTAVEWFYENTQNYVRLSDTIPMVIKIEVPFEEYMNILKQAKKMEKEQIRSAYVSGFDDGEYLKTYLDLEYYNETYGKDNG